MASDERRAAPTSLAAGAALATVFACQVALALIIVPPWQNPDEPQHLITVLLVNKYGPDSDLAQHDLEYEGAIIGSMAEYGWWTHYGRPTPDPLPPTFETGPALVVRGFFGPPPNGSRLYYRGVAAVFRTFGIDGLLAQLYTMRLLSALMGALTLPFVWIGTAIAVNRRSAIVVTALITLLPQFVIVSTTAGPDAVVNLLGAVVWWRSVLYVRQPGVRHLLWLWLAGIAAFLTRRVGAPLLVFAILLPAARAIWTARGPRRREAGWLAAAFVIVAVVGVAVWPVLPPDVYRALAWSQFDVAAALKSGLGRIGALPGFLAVLYQTFWLSAGWARYAAPAWWQAVTVAMAVIAAAGLAGCWRRDQASTIGPILLAAALVAWQLAIIVAFYFGLLNTGALGRYMFPVLPAVASLIWLGWDAAWQWLGRERVAAPAIVTLMVALNLAGWLLVFIPRFA